MQFTHLVRDDKKKLLRKMLNTNVAKFKSSTYYSTDTLNERRPFVRIDNWKLNKLAEFVTDWGETIRFTKIF